MALPLRISIRVVFALAAVAIFVIVYALALLRETLPASRMTAPALHAPRKI